MRAMLRSSPYRAQSVVFVAADFGAHLVPVTLNMPKLLIRVHVKCIIDGLIDAYLIAEIEKIYIRVEDVVGMCRICFTDYFSC